MPRDAQVGSITNTIKRERKEERDHTLYYIVTEREKKKERKREREKEREREKGKRERERTR